MHFDFLKQRFCLSGTQVCHNYSTTVHLNNFFVRQMPDRFCVTGLKVQFHFFQALPEAVSLAGPLRKPIEKPLSGQAIQA